MPSEAKSCVHVGGQASRQLGLDLVTPLGVQTTRLPGLQVSASAFTPLAA
jgi:hypothetical protein